MMKIGNLAKRVGVGIDTVRYYEREGLLPQAQRRSSGYRLYDVKDIQRLRFIRRAKTLGFTLTEVRDLLTLSSRKDDDMAAMKAAAQQKLADVDAKITELTRIRDGLGALIGACPGRGALARCPIMNAISEESA